MKRLLLIIAVLFSVLSVNAQTTYYKTTKFTKWSVSNGNLKRLVKTKSNGKDIIVCVNLNTEEIKIFSAEEQDFKIKFEVTENSRVSTYCVKIKEKNGNIVNATIHLTKVSGDKYKIRICYNNCELEYEMKKLYTE